MKVSLDTLVVRQIMFLKELDMYFCDYIDPDIVSIGSWILQNYELDLMTNNQSSMGRGFIVKCDGERWLR